MQFSSRADVTLPLDAAVLENGEIDIDVDDHLKERACGLIEYVGIGVGIEFLRKELR